MSALNYALDASVTTVALIIAYGVISVAEYLVPSISEFSLALIAAVVVTKLLWRKHDEEDGGQEDAEIADGSRGSAYGGSDPTAS